MTTNNPPKSEVSIENIRKQAWDEAILTYGTAYIFEQRSHKFRRLLRIPAFLGIVVPMTVGVIYLSFQVQEVFKTGLTVVAGILSVTQVIASARSLSAKWEETYSYALESTSANYSLSTRFANLGRSTPKSLSDLQLRFELLQTENSLRSDQDVRQGITDAEKRKGMRAGLRKFQRQCAACHQVPTSMKPSNCDVCGNF